MSGFVDGVKEFYSGFDSVIPVTKIVKNTVAFVGGIAVSLALEDLNPIAGGMGDWVGPPKP